MADVWTVAALAAACVVGQAHAAYGGSAAAWCFDGVAVLLIAPVLRRSSVPAGLTVVIGLCVGGGWLGMQGVLRPVFGAGDVGGWQLPRDAIIEGRVMAAARGVSGRSTLWIQVQRRVDTGEEAFGSVRVSARDQVPPEIGALVRAAVRLRRPSNFRTPGAFDWIRYLAHRRTYVVGSVRGDLVVLVPPPPGPALGLTRWRAGIDRAIGTATTGDTAAVLRALVIGDDDGLSVSIRDGFARAGVVHVLSVSGLHLALMAGGVGMLLRRMLERSERLLLWGNMNAAAALGGAAAAGGYGLLAGMETPTLRSAVMVAVAAAGAALGRPVSAATALAAAALGIVWGWPGAAFETGFQLSFVSVAALLATARGHRDGESRSTAIVCGAVRSSLVASLATAPLTALYFHQVSLVGAAANLVVIPLFGTVVLAPALIGALCVPVAPNAADWCFWAAGVVLAPAVRLVAAIGGHPWAACQVPSPTALEAVAIYGAALVVWQQPRWAPVMTAAVIVFLLGAEREVLFPPTPRQLRVTFLDVGQGDAAVAEMPDGRVVVVDGGGFPGSDFDVGRAVLLPYLATRRIRAIDLVVVTHPHPDHFAGLRAVFEQHAVREWWWNGMGGETQWRMFEQQAMATPRRRPVPQDAVDGWPTLSVLHPPLGWTSGANEGSLVFRLGHGAASVLFTGDAERLAEHAMVEGEGMLAAAVIKVPHHGSATSSTSAFLDRVRPRIAVVSAGPDNRYGHPAPAVEARYAARGVCVLRTDRCGAVTLVTDGNTISAAAEVSACRCPAVRLRPPP